MVSQSVSGPAAASAVTAVPVLGASAAVDARTARREATSLPSTSPRPGADRRRLVLGTAISFGVPQLRVFVESLRENYSGDAMILVRWPGIGPARYLARHRIDVARVFRPVRSAARFMRGATPSITTICAPAQTAMTR